SSATVEKGAPPRNPLSTQESQMKSCLSNSPGALHSSRREARAQAGTDPAARQVARAESSCLRDNDMHAPPRPTAAQYTPEYRMAKAAVDRSRKDRAAREPWRGRIPPPEQRPCRARIAERSGARHLIWHLKRRSMDRLAAPGEPPRDTRSAGQPQASIS